MKVRATATTPTRNTVGALLREARGRLGGVSTTARCDAEVLLGEAVGLSRAALIASADQTVDAATLERFGHLLEERLRGRPIAYLLGRREFWSLDLLVNAYTLIPRPETETLVKTALGIIDAKAPVRVADLGTGTGAVALAIASERRGAQVLATDMSDAALEVARANADRHRIHNVEFRAGGWFGPLRGLRFHVIVSNPPYVAEGDPHLNEGDLRFEPQTALVAGTDGLEAIREIVAGAPSFLLPAGWLILEHGGDQGPAVRELLRRHGFGAISTATDLAGLERVTAGARRDA